MPKLVLDTSVFLDQVKLNLDDELFTVPAVYQELKDKASQDYFQSLNVTLTEPDSEAYLAVVAFSKLTGDFPSLSATDLKVIALTWHLEKLTVGNTLHLRSIPITPRTNLSAPIQKPVINKVEDSLDLNDLSSEIKDIDDSTAQDLDESEVIDINILKDSLKDDTMSIKSSTSVKPVAKKQILKGWVETDDDDAGWIVPPKKQTIAQQQPKITCLVACMSSDFAIQNVLLQFKLNLISQKGTRIKRLKTWVLRCHACFKTTSKMTLKFCPSCGNPALLRTSVGVDENGNTIVYLKKNFQYNTRGTIYSIPTPKGGRKNTDLFLREDQREYVKAVRDANHKNGGGKKVDLFDPDVIPLDGWGKWSGKREPTIGHGRKNVNINHKKFT